MSINIDFKVIFSSSNEDGYSPYDLETYNSTSKGWQSSRFCEYPQELILMLSQTTKISKIQILSHHCNIASKIEIFVSSPTNIENSLEQSLTSSKFKRLGYVIMSSNENSNFKACELKSVHISAECLFVKLVVHKNHINKLNLYNQVSIIGVKIIGSPCFVKDAGLNKKFNDQETAFLFKKLEEKIRLAVLEEQFDYADTLKMTMNNLMKLQSDECRHDIHHKVCNLLEIDKTEYMQSGNVQKTMNLATRQISINFDTCHTIQSSQSIFRNTSDIILPVLHFAEKKDEHLQYANTSTQSMELPRIIKNDFHGSNSENQLGRKSEVNVVSNIQEEEISTDLPHLTETEERESSAIIDVFGMNMAQKLFSKSWKHRQQLIIDLLNEINVSTSDHCISVNISRAIASVLHKVLQDQVFVVFSEGILLLKVFMSYFPHKSLGRSETSLILGKLLTLILKRTGDANPRIRLTITAAVTEISLLPVLKSVSILPDIIVKLIKKRKNLSRRFLKSQINIMQALIKNLGLNTAGGFSTDQVMSVLIFSLEHPNNEVREASLNCFLEAYHHVKSLKSHLPPSSRKNPLYSKLFNVLDKIDGELTKTEKKVDLMKQYQENDKIELKSQQKDMQLKDNKKVTGTTVVKKDVNPLQPLKLPNDVLASEKKVASRCTKNEMTPKTGLEEYMNKMCVFCGTDVDEDVLDVHYWNSCLMLKPCPNCSQVVEISTINKHLVEECEEKKNYETCGQCRLSVLRTALDQHSETCQNFLKIDQVMCPICYRPLTENDQNWSDHLLNKCPPNIRRLEDTKKNRVPSSGSHLNEQFKKDNATSKLPVRSPYK